MTKRVTVVLDDDLVKKLLLLQSKYITNAAKGNAVPKSKSRNKSISFSYVVGLVLRKEFK